MNDRYLTIRERVVGWAMHNDVENYRYGSPQYYWRNAKEAGVITQEEFDLGRNVMGTMWSYRGD